jgi:hypothetical protein
MFGFKSKKRARCIVWDEKFLPHLNRILLYEIKAIKNKIFLFFIAEKICNT